MILALSCGLNAIGFITISLCTSIQRSVKSNVYVRIAAPQIIDYIGVVILTG